MRAQFVFEVGNPAQFLAGVGQRVRRGWCRRHARAAPRPALRRDRARAHARAYASSARRSPSSALAETWPKRCNDHEIDCSRR